MTAADLEPKVGEDGWHCEPDYPFLEAGSNESPEGRCTKHDVALDWYDYYIAYCTQGAIEVDG